MLDFVLIHRLCTAAGLESLQGLLVTNLSFAIPNLGSDVLLGSLRGLPIAHLSLAGSEWLTDAGLENLKDLPLTALSMPECTRVTDAGLGAIEKLTMLSCLNLRDCSGLSNAAVGSLVEGMPSLTCIIFPKWDSTQKFIVLQGGV